MREAPRVRVTGCRTLPSCSRYSYSSTSLVYPRSCQFSEPQFEIVSIAWVAFDKGTAFSLKLGIASAYHRERGSV